MRIAITLPKNANYVPWVNALIDRIVRDYKNLTITGITPDSEFSLTQGIHGISKDAVIVIGDETHYNVDWYPNAKAAYADGFRDSYALDTDFSKIMDFLSKLSNTKNSVNNRNTTGSITAPCGMRASSKNAAYTRYGTKYIVNNYIPGFLDRPTAPAMKQYELIGYMLVS